MFSLKTSDFLTFSRNLILCRVKYFLKRILNEKYNSVSSKNISHFNFCEKVDVFQNKLIFFDRLQRSPTNILKLKQKRCTSQIISYSFFLHKVFSLTIFLLRTLSSNRSFKFYKKNIFYKDI